jgi:hypothetical protein
MLLIRAFGCHFVSFRVHVQAFGWTLGKSGPIGLIGPFATAPRRGADAAVLPQHDCQDGGKGKELTSLKVIEPSEPSEPSSLFFEAREIPIWPNLSPYQKHHGNHQICLPSGHIDVTLTSHWCHVEMRRLRGYAATRLVTCFTGLCLAARRSRPAMARPQGAEFRTPKIKQIEHIILIHFDHQFRISNVSWNVKVPEIRNVTS